MLRIVRVVTPETVERLFAVYRESMEDLAGGFESPDAMREEYTAFLREFLGHPERRVLIEEVDGRWVSGLRAIETAPGRWFLEAVETCPEERGKGYAQRLLRETASYLKERGAEDMACLIARTNGASIAAHRAGGFVPTEKPPVDWDGALCEGCVRFERVC